MDQGELTTADFLYLESLALKEDPFLAIGVQIFVVFLCGNICTVIIICSRLRVMRCDTATSMACLTLLSCP